MDRVQSRQALAMVLLPPIGIGKKHAPSFSQAPRLPRSRSTPERPLTRSAARRLYWHRCDWQLSSASPLRGTRVVAPSWWPSAPPPGRCICTGYWSPLVQSLGGGRSTAHVGGSESAPGCFPEGETAADVAASDGSAAGARGPSKNRAEQVIQGLGLGARSRRRRSSPLTAEDAAKQVVQAETCAALVLLAP